MSVDELRAGLAKIAEAVVPDPDPYERLLRHARRRRRRRFAGFAATVAAVLAAALAGPALSPAGLHHRADDLPLGHGHRIDSPWSWRLINSPTRGSLAGDEAFVAEVARLFDHGRDEVRMAADLPKVKVLYADESAGFRQVVLAYHSATAAALVTREGPAGASPARLLRGDGQSNGRVEPFNLLTATSGMPGAQKQWLLGLAPAGCRISLGRAAYAGQSGLRRQWQAQPTDGYLLVEQAASDGWWRVECDGQVRQEGPMWFAETDRAGNADETYPDDGRWAPTAEPPNPTVARQAGQVYQALARQAGLVDAARPAIRWSGRLDAQGGEAVLLATQDREGPTLLLTGDTGAGPLLALATDQDPAPTDPAPAPAGPLRPPLVATGYGPADDLLAVRVPVRDGDRAVLGGQLLVVPCKGVTRIEAVADGAVRASAPVAGGAALLALPVGSVVMLRGLDRNGAVRCYGPLLERASGERVFNEPLVSNW
ncbi:hypothetical protein ONA91_06950 [Micromonospora sp. DR5-3]|uniref:hypothetical protein n=1 Tax=unclassified Micromonospora TaxID=2617518 RepID=UPI0011DA5739|nr:MULTISPECIES: hypothetical protein [unclassified Micromonospora]MCW3814193.1 hypothetical protein [Micromonospora sp. DR5-3]TYC25074.1 hypothetical protein FXF52_07120 [Micromonospora sp. MP36]